MKKNIIIILIVVVAAIILRYLTGVIGEFITNRAMKKQPAQSVLVEPVGKRDYKEF